MENKRRFQEEIKARMSEWDKKIKEFRTRAEKADSESKTKIREKIHDIETKKLIMKQRLRELDESSGDTWKEISAVLEKAAVDLKQTFENAAAYFKKKA